MPNFTEIGQTSLKIGGVNWASDKKKLIYLSRTETAVCERRD